VPVNEYGNVEVFQPWMLPKGTVQIRGLLWLCMVVVMEKLTSCAAAADWTQCVMFYNWEL